MVFRPKKECSQDRLPSLRYFAESGFYLPNGQEGHPVKACE